MTHAPVYSPTVQNAFTLFEKHADAQSKPGMLEQLTRVLDIIEMHSRLPAEEKETLKTSAILWKANILVANPITENNVDMTFGKKVVDNLKALQAPNAMDETNIVGGCAIVMAFSCARMESTLEKLLNPSTHDAGVRESGGLEKFKDYLSSLCEERLMFRAFSQTPALLKYEMQLTDRIVAGISANAPSTPAIALTAMHT